MENIVKNPFVWCEIYVDDLARARKFYEEVLQAPFEEIITYLNNSYHLNIQIPQLINNKLTNKISVNIEFLCGDNHIMALEYKKYNNNELNSIDENKIEKMAIERFYSLI